MGVALAETSTDHHCKRCGRLLPQNPKGGRRFQWCPQSPDEPGVGCQELDKREQATLERAGLGELVNMFRAQEAALAADVAPLHDYGQRVDELKALVRQIGEVSIARAEKADEARLRAEAAQRTAEREAREAEQRTTRAYELRDEALAERDRAVEDEQQARRDADAAIDRALKAENARGQAQGFAEANARAVQDERQRREDADGVADRLRGELTALQSDLQGARAALGDAERAASGQRAEHEQQLAQAARAEAGLRLAHQEQLAATDHELAVTRTDLSSARADGEALRTRTEVLTGEVEDGNRRLEALRTELDTARTEALRDVDRLTQQAATAGQARAEAERRYDALVTALGHSGFTARTDGTPGDE